jgi:hypothetical protein
MHRQPDHHRVRRRIKERGRFGAHFTPLAFVERRLVQPLVIDPLSEDWNGINALALTQYWRHIEARRHTGRPLLRLGWAAMIAEEAPAGGNLIGTALHRCWSGL